jgi:PAS domain S-box-containing protein
MGVDDLQCTAASSERDHLRRQLRLHAAMVQTTASLSRARTRQQLFDATCRIAVEVGGFRAAWIGLVAPGETVVQMVAGAGALDGYLEAVSVSTEPHLGGRGPFGRALLERRPVVCGDTATDPSFEPWRLAALARGHRSLAVLPLIVDGEALGAMVHIADQPEGFDTAEIEVLSLLAADLSAAIGRLDAEQHRHSAEEALRASESRFRTVFEQAPLGICVVGSDYRFRRVNQGFCAMLGYTAEELLAQGSCIETTHVDDRAADAGAVGRLIAGAGKVSLEKRYLRKDGVVVWAQLTLALLSPQPDARERFIGIIEDITERRAVADQVREQAALIDLAQDAIIVGDLERRILFWSRGAERIYGYTAQEAIGQRAPDLLIREPQTPDLAAALKSTLEHGQWTGELERRTKHGQPRTVEARWTLVRDAGGQPTSILSIDTDVTEKKKLEQQFLRAQRMESIGRLAGGVAHDLNNMLAPILMSVTMLKEGERDPERLEDLQTLQSCALRSAEMVRQLLSFARGSSGNRTLVDLRETVAEVKAIVRDTFPKNLTLIEQADLRGWHVNADPTQMHQLLTNLCVNARDAMPQGGRLSIALTRANLDDVYVAMHPGARPGPHVLLEVADTGTGMPPAVLDRIFEPFFTTKDVGRGTGLGLSTVHAIVKSHGGFLAVESELERGSRFKIYLPADVNDDEAPGLEPERPPLPGGRGELVLVVDDEEGVRRLARRTLESHGYRVILASHGADAVALYAERRREVALVLTDMRMPVMDGPATVVALRAINPSVVVVGSSGLDSDGLAARAREAGASIFVAKPYTAEALLTAVDQALRSSR